MLCSNNVTFSCVLSGSEIHTVYAKISRTILNGTFPNSVQISIHAMYHANICKQNNDYSEIVNESVGKKNPDYKFNFCEVFFLLLALE